MTKKKSKKSSKSKKKKRSSKKKSKKTEFSAGDKIVHPAHGAGVIEAIEQPDILDDFNRYYVIELAASDMRVMVPVSSADELGLRKVMTKTKSKQVFRMLKKEAEDLPNDFKARQAAIGKRLKEGDIDELTKVVRDMAARSLIKTYSPTEARLYEQARTMLSGEMALSIDTDVEDALEQIDEVLEVHAERLAKQQEEEAED